MRSPFFLGQGLCWPASLPDFGMRSEEETARLKDQEREFYFGVEGALKVLETRFRISRE